MIPGQALTKAETVAAMAESPGWDTFRIAEPRIVQPTDDERVRAMLEEAHSAE